MSDDRHLRLGRIFLHASNLPESEREGYLRETCGVDAALRDEVRQMLSHHGDPVSPLDCPVISRTLQEGLLAQTTDEAPPMTIGGYKVIRVLGVGGMGVVYLAEQERPRRTIALKVIKPGLTSPSLLKRFELEQEVLGRLQHPGIAQIFEAGVHKPDDTDDRRQWQPYFAMEYVEGLPLTEYCAVNHLGDRARLELAARIADAVHHAHQRGVIHRDLKPGNVLVDELGQPKILDFGVARSTGSDVQVTTLHTDVGQLIGTLPYMSPEQVAGDPSQIDTRSDVYALGVITYQLLTGHMPHDLSGRSIPEAARIIIDLDPTPMSSINRVFRGDLDTIVAKALEKDRGRRYQSAAEFAADLRRYLSDEAIVARPASRLYLWSKFAKRNKGLVAGVAMAFAFLVAGLVGTSVGWAKAVESRKEALESEQAARRAEADARVAEAMAERRFDEVRSLANKFIFETYEQVTPLAGSTKVRKHILATGLEYLDRLAKEGADDTALLLDIAEGYARVGDVQGYGSRANLGDFEGALASQTKAMEIRQRVLAAEPENARAQKSVALSHNSFGNLFMGKGDSDQALMHFREAQRLRTAIADRDPTNLMSQREVALSHQWVGNALLQAKRPLEALESYDASLHMQRRLLQADPTKWGTTRDVTVALEKIGDVHRDMGHELQKTLQKGEKNPHYEAAIKAYDESRTMRVKLREEHPTNQELASDLAASCSKCGDILVRMDRVAEAMPHLQESVQLAQMVVDADSDNAWAKTNLVVSYHKLAAAYAAQGEDARVEAERRLAALEESVRLNGLGIDLLNTLRQAGKLEPRFVEWIDLLGQAKHAAEDALRKKREDT
jgi:eukaryotic-like serine/threonine-protein kinase